MQSALIFRQKEKQNELFCTHMSFYCPKIPAQIVMKRFFDYSIFWHGSCDI